MIVYANGKVVATNVDGDTQYISSSQQGNFVKLYFNTDNLEERLDKILNELRKLVLHLSVVTDIYLTDQDIGDRE